MSDIQTNLFSMDRLRLQVSEVVDSLKTLDVGPSLELVIRDIENKKLDIESKYKMVCDEIESRMHYLVDSVVDIKKELIRLDNELLEKEKQGNYPYCSIYSKVPPINENISDPEYAEFLEKYNQELKMSQEVSEKEFETTQLVNIQRSFDNAYSSAVMVVDYLINRLRELVNNYKFSKTPDLMRSYQEKYCNLGKLYEMIEKGKDEVDNFVFTMKNVVERNESSVDKRFSSSKKITDNELDKSIFEK